MEMLLASSEAFDGYIPEHMWEKAFDNAGQLPNRIDVDIPSQDISLPHVVTGDPADKLRDMCKESLRGLYRSSPGIRKHMARNVRRF